MKKILILLAVLGLVSVPSFAALQDDIAAKADNAEQNANYEKLYANGKYFVFTGAHAEDRVFQLNYTEVQPNGMAKDAAGKLYIRFYPNYNELKGSWTTDENFLEYVSKGVHNPAKGTMEEQEMLSAELGNHSSSADRKVLTNGGLLQVVYIDFNTTRENVTNKKGFLMNLIALVANIEAPMSYEVERIAKARSSYGI